MDNDEAILGHENLNNIHPERIVISQNKKTEERFQMPIVVLVTNFQKRRDGPTLLTLHEIDTLFHEMGHAMHCNIYLTIAMLAQTELQHVSGTRVAMDFVEVPSILMECIAANPETLSFGRHYKTGQRIPAALLKECRSGTKQMEAFELQHQILMSMLDQQYHSNLALNSNFNSSDILARLQDASSPIKSVENTAWQVQFSHLSSYGASYYSYLWSRRWASRIFDRLFSGKLMNEWREGGQTFRSELLCHGGSISPWIGLDRIGVVKDGEMSKDS